MNDYERFKEAVKNHVLDFMPERYRNAEVVIEKMPVNNGEAYEKMMIDPGGRETLTSICLDPYYQWTLLGTPVEEMVRLLAEEYVAGEKVIPELRTEDLTDYEKTRNRLQVRLVNLEMNREFLQEVPHKKLEHLNLAAVFHIRFDNTESCGHTALVKNWVLDAWKTDVETLYRTALANTMDMLPPYTENLTSAISMAMPGTKMKKPVAVTILTNQEGMFGAAAVLYPGVLAELAAARGTSLFILPSSIHEVLCMDDDGQQDVGNLHQMVMEINHQEVKPEEVLSNEVYYYDRTEQSLSMLTSPEENRDRLRQIPKYTLVQEPVIFHESER